ERKAASPAERCAASRPRRTADRAGPAGAMAAGHAREASRKRRATRAGSLLFLPLRLLARRLLRLRFRSWRLRLSRGHRRKRLLRERAQRMSLRRAGEELLQVFLGPGRVRALQLVKADLGEGGLRRGRAAVVSAHLLERGDHRLLPLLLARERFLAWLGRSFRGDRPRLQLDRLRQLCAGFRLA